MRLRRYDERKGSAFPKEAKFTGGSASGERHSLGADFGAATVSQRLTAHHGGKAAPPS